MSGAPSGPETLVREVLHGLAEGRYVPGQRLVEPDLMQRTGLGRSSVREGLGRLAAMGVVDHVPHRGATVRLLTRRAAADVLRVTERLLGLAARQAAEAVRGGADAGALAAAARDLDAAPGAERTRARARFYRALTVLGGNDELDRLMPLLQVHLIRAQLRGARPEGAGARAALVAAILAGDPAAAEAAAAARIGALITALDGVPDSAFAPDQGRIITLPALSA